MKKVNATIFQVVAALGLMLVFSLAFNSQVYGQCANSTPFGTVTAPSTPATLTISGCTYGVEYNTINGAQAGATYTLTADQAGTGVDLTVREGSPAGPVLAFGTGSVTVTPTVTGPIYLHVCTGVSTCYTTTITCTSCVPPPVPANDLCANATAIAVPSATTGTTLGATSDTAPTCVTSNSGQPGVWYSFTSNVGNGSNRVELNTCLGTGFDSKLLVFKGGCGALTCVTGNDDNCGLQSRVNVTTTGGNTTYQALVQQFGTTGGAFTLSALQLASITNIAAGAQTACDITNNQYTQTLTLTYLAAPTTGELVVNGQSFPITGSPQTVVLTGLSSNGQPVNVTASFSADPASSVTVNNLFTAPAKCNLCKVNCPADIFVNLLAGECSSYVNYDITTSGECSTTGTVSNFESVFDPANWTVGLVNSNGGVNTAGAPARRTLRQP